MTEEDAVWKELKDDWTGRVFLSNIVGSLAIRVVSMEGNQIIIQSGFYENGNIKWCEGEGSKSSKYAMIWELRLDRYRRLFEPEIK